MTGSGRIDGLVACSSAQALGWSLAKQLDVPLLPAVVRPHPDGELSIELSPDARGKRMALVGSFHRPVHQHLFEFALIADALVHMGVQEIVGVIPYLAYARQDRVDHPGVPLSMDVVVRMLQSERMAGLVMVELHNPKTAQLFSLPIENLRAERLVADELKKTLLPEMKNPLLLSPDRGRSEWVATIGEHLGLLSSWMEKERISDREVTVTVDEELTDKDVVLLDDMIATGGSMERAVRLVRERGASSVHCVAVHGVFAEHAETRLFTAGAESIRVTNSIPSGFAVIDVTPLLADALRG